MEKPASINWHQSVDYYCERMDTSFWAEPINAITNIFFIIAALLAFKMWHKSAARSWDLFVFAALIAIVGVGSFIFHTMATKAAALADVIPIALFIHFGLAVFLYRVANAGLLWTMLGVFAFVILSIAFRKYVDIGFINYSAQYIPAVLLLLGMSAFTAIKKIPAAKYFVMAALMFIISLTIRTFDMVVCSYLPIGVHYMWHLLNAIVMYLVFKGVISYSRISVNV